jgi:hypothetical protein
MNWHIIILWTDSSIALQPLTISLLSLAYKMANVECNSWGLLMWRLYSLVGLGDQNTDDFQLLFGFVVNQAEIFDTRSQEFGTFGKLLSKKDG